ncbi:UDP-N-acetylglucosamine diphosphorylase/glucosamine-1-phosphate N-acetyltransferase [Rickettsiales endosymbiont of Peranema trichophorum]|uniref:bifunctional UDP-N-acetylglucosamine diphosphorylase/glucosamine-1-phosphate N-acetyltransferase GlmU n=1 Tax=Rickettsiales endosymbiont of Peranema trichophorum TaxID=2486577 RepID=UPI001023226B|nr:bifunctional UDP-N-acetylglucosamine diphosphorylase/glucosamine-1-phosphate N-acetyltransferase GlmU [Rickettsiales endosymbiont of Peranema trichophorum]RZI45245.1 UDP-N-acetylglucosamine diphosphorylase/glucosamine-1-phosphate N-acetyltransferase [Rickettsiales endosymbiont of Peranema trichophorum]
MIKLTIVVLAGGKGTRMRTTLPKVLHELTGLGLLEHVIRVTADLKTKLARTGFDRSINAVHIVASEALAAHTSFKELIEKYGCTFCIQKEQLGTGDALRCAIDDIGVEDLEDSNRVLVLCGDAPLVSADTLVRAVEQLESTKASVLVAGFNTKNPMGYGRLIRDGEVLLDIVEEKEADDDIKKIALCNSGVMLFNTHDLLGLFGKLENDNATGEYYLTDLIGIATKSGMKCAYVLCEEIEAMGVNDLHQLAYLEDVLQKRLRQKFLSSGVMLLAPDTVFFSADTIIAPSVKIYPYVFIGKDVIIEEGTVIHSFTHLECANIGKNCSVGPYARLRPNVVLDENVKIGNFVELKNAEIAKNSKASHLSYIGDASIGEDCNVGAGTIFCNYDGKKKHRSDIGKKVLIGANVSIISPIRIDDNVIVGAGSVITENIERDSLAIGRAKQTNLKRRKNENGTE